VLDGVGTTIIPLPVAFGESSSPVSQPLRPGRCLFQDYSFTQGADLALLHLVFCQVSERRYSLVAQRDDESGVTYVGL
jgi:hypothetical protein